LSGRILILEKTIFEMKKQDPFQTQDNLNTFSFNMKRIKEVENKQPREG